MAPIRNRGEPRFPSVTSPSFSDLAGRHYSKLGEDRFHHVVFGVDVPFRFGARHEILGPRVSLEVFLPVLALNRFRKSLVPERRLRLGQAAWTYETAPVEKCGVDPLLA